MKSGIYKEAMVWKTSSASVTLTPKECIPSRTGTETTAGAAFNCHPTQVVKHHAGTSQSPRGLTHKSGTIQIE